MTQPTYDDALANAVLFADVAANTEVAEPSRAASATMSLAWTALARELREAKAQADGATLRAVLRDARTCIDLSDDVTDARTIWWLRGRARAVRGGVREER